ncbi:hypothetical protein J2S43_000810 [Catenuloplanes nepalensis]|uniref:Uncharacterized protein n=1 Tax=Catenuloplanes nepalensis TaxID=587533 RepID=A0ABT9MLL7_9ACTN|nr:hypothetical protein [Catenuloplanes nepalensis]MDP9792298.1 hypothetical protein [Catenuloplanes nepalensis]
MIEVATDAIVVPTIVLIMIVRAARRLLRRRRTRTAERPRLALLEFVAEAGAEGVDELVTMPRREWRATAAEASG